MGEMDVDDESAAEKVFAPDTEDEAEKEIEEWIDVEGGAAAPNTPKMSPKEGSKGLSQRSDDEKMWKELFENAEEENVETSWKKWKSMFDDDDVEEGRKPKMAQAVPKASKEEKEIHDCTHCPFRIWCRYCVEGRCHKMGHMHKKSDDKMMDAVPRISMDYFYMSKKDEKAKAFPMIVAVDESTGDKYARATGRKGVEGCDWLIKDFSEELQTWGHAGGSGGKIILKCDGENALKAFRNALAKYHGGIVIPEAPAKG